jgi:hypothetical protein
MTEQAKVPLVQFLLPYSETASGLLKRTEMARHAFNAFALRMEIMAEDDRVRTFYVESNIAAAGSRIDRSGQDQAGEGNIKEGMPLRAPVHLWHRAQFFGSFTSKAFWPLWHFPQKSPLVSLFMSIVYAPLDIWNTW